MRVAVVAVIFRLAQTLLEAQVAVVMEEPPRLLEVQTPEVVVERAMKILTLLVRLAVQASLSSKSPMPIVRHFLAVLPTLYRLQAQT